MSKNIKIIALILCFLMFVGGCAKKQDKINPAPTTTPNGTVVPEATQPLLTGPERQDEGIFPVHALNGNALVRIYLDGDVLVQQEITPALEYTFAGVAYSVMKYYKASDTLYYATNMYADNNIVYGDLYKYADRANILLDTKVRISSISFADDVPSVLYVVNDQLKDNRLVLYAGNTKQVLDTNVYKAYFSSAKGDVIYLKAETGANIENMLNKYSGKNAILNPVVTYELKYKPLDAETIIMGNTGEIFRIDRVRNLICTSIGLEQSVYVNDTITFADVLLIPLRGGSYTQVENVIIDDWQPSMLYTPVDFLRIGDPKRKDRISDLYFTDFSSGLNASNVLSVRYLSSDNSAYAYEQMLGEGTQIVVNHTDGTQLFLPQEYKTDLITFYYDKRNETVYFLYTQQENNYLGAVSIKGEPIITVLATNPIVCQGADEGIVFSKLNEYSSSCEVYYFNKGQTPIKLADGAVYEGEGHINHPAQRYIISKDKNKVLYITRTSPFSDEYSLQMSVKGGSPTLVTDMLDLKGRIIYNSDFSQIAASRTDNSMYVISEGMVYSVDGQFRILDDNGSKAVEKNVGTIWQRQE